MRKSLILLSLLALIPAGALALSATVQMSDAASVPQASAAGIDLEAIPVKPVTGHLAVTGVAADDEDDDGLGIIKGKKTKVMSSEDEGFASEGEDD